LLDPGLDFGKVPYDAPRREIEAAGKFAALFQLIDGRISQRHELAQFRTPDGPLEKMLTRPSLMAPIGLPGRIEFII
jgi:hypothetical protein